MSGTKAPVSLPITVEGGERATVELEKISRSVRNLDNSFGTLAGRIKSGLQWHLVYNGIRLIERSIYSLATAIPDLIGKGQKWAAVVDDMSDATGMSARQSSELAAVQLMLGGSTESLGKAMVQLSKNARMHEDVLKEMGVATRNAHGGFLGIYQILQNLRNAYSATGDGATRFARAYQQLGRGTREVTDLLSLNAGQYALLADQAQRAGLVMNDTMARNAETLRRTQGILEATITGLGTQILGGVAPVLTALVNGVSQAIQSNMGNIVRFAVQVVNTIAGLVGGLFGIDFDLVSLAGQMDLVGKKGEQGGAGLGKFGKGGDAAASGADRASKAIQRQIDAIDRQLKALDRLEKREDAKAEHAKLMNDIRAAKAELDDIRSQSIFAAGMSDAEAELARQALAANVEDGIKKVKDAELALAKWKREQERDRLREQLQMQRDALQEQLQAQRAANGSMIASASLAGIRMGKGLSQGFKPLTKGMKDAQADLMQLGRDSLQTGRDIAEAIKTFLFGAETGGAGARTTTGTRAARGGIINPDILASSFTAGSAGTRSGGLAGFLNQIGTLGGFLSDNTDALKALAVAFAAWKVGGAAVTGARTIFDIGAGLLGGGATGATAGGGLSTVASAIAAAAMVVLPAAATVALGNATFGWFGPMGPSVPRGKGSSDHPLGPMDVLPWQKPGWKWPKGARGQGWSGAGGTGGTGPLFGPQGPASGPEAGFDPQHPVYVYAVPKPGNVDTGTSPTNVYPPTTRPGVLTSVAQAVQRALGIVSGFDPVVPLPESAGPQPGPAPGLGFNGAAYFGINALTSALEQSQRGVLGDGSTVVTQLQNIDSSIQSLVSVLAPDGTDAPPTNTGSLADKVDRLAARMTTAEAVNQTQSGRLDSLASKNEGQDGVIAAIKVVNTAQAKVLKAHDARIAAGKAVNAVQAAILSGHEKRIKALENGGDSRGAAGRTAGRSQVLNVTLQLDGRATRQFLGGRAVTSTTRPVPGV